MDVGGLVDRFRRSAFGMDDWDGALVALAVATDAQIVHLAGLDAGDAPVFNLICGVTPDMLDAFVREGGLDSRCNPRTGLALHGPMLRTVADDELVTARERDALPIYRNFFNRTAAAHAAITRLQMPQVNAVVAALRPHSFLESAREERRLIEAIAPALSDIMMQAIQLGSQHDRTTLLTAEALEGAVLLLDGDRRIVAMSAGVEPWLAADGPLTVRGGQVRARDAGCDARLATAIARACDAGQALRPGQSVVLHTPRVGPAAGEGRLVVTVRAVPRRGTGPLGRARVMLSRRTPPAPAAALYAELFDLTMAEAQIAEQLAQGDDLAVIAERRGASVATVRTQLKALFAKTGTRRQGELVARLHAIGG